MRISKIVLASLLSFSILSVQAAEEDPLHFGGDSAIAFFTLLEHFKGQVLKAPRYGYVREVVTETSTAIELRDPEGSLEIFMRCLYENESGEYSCWMDAPWREVVDGRAAVWQVLGETLFDMGQMLKEVNLLELAKANPESEEIQFKFGSITFICEELERVWDEVSGDEVPVNECLASIVEFPVE